MPLTTNGLRYPNPTDSPNVPVDLQELAEDTDTLALARFRRATATHLKNNTAVLADDPNYMNIPLGVGNYRVILHGVWTCTNAAADLLVGWSYSGGLSNIARLCQGMPTSGTTPTDTTMRHSFLTSFSGTTYGVPASGGSTVVEDLLIQTTSAGNLALQWAQAVATAVDTVRQASSRIYVERVFAA